MIDPALLIHRYLEGLLDAEEGREFNARVKAEPEFRALLARMSYDVAALRNLLASEAAPASLHGPRSAVSGLRFAWPVAAAAAVLIGIVAMVLFSGTPATGPTVISGKTETVNGRMVVKETAVIRFLDGATAELESSTEAVIHSKGVDLQRGGGRFRGAVRVSALGAIVSGGEFKVVIHADSLIINGDVEIDRGGLRTRSTGEKIVAREKRGAEHREWVRHDRELRQASITLERAIEIATRKGGAAVEAKLEEDEGKIVFEVKLAGGEKVEIDAVSGEEIDRDPEKTSAAPAITLANAIEIALRDVPGKAVEVDVEKDAIEVLIVWGDRLVWVKIDSKSGAVVDRGIEED